MEPVTVLVTGASGYIASHLITALLSEGKHRVKGTVRSLSKPEKVSSIYIANILFSVFSYLIIVFHV